MAAKSNDPGGDAGELAAELGPAQRVVTLWRGRALGLALLVLNLLIYAFLVTDDAAPRRFLFDFYQFMDPREPVSALPAIVAIDEKSIAEHGQWPWPRIKVAELIDRIGAAGALVIGVDILFLEPDRQSPARAIPAPQALQPAVREFLATLPDYDETLVDAIARNPVVLALAGTRRGAGLNGPPRVPPIAFEDAALLERLPRFPGADQSIEAISAAALGQGLVNPIEDVDAIIRRVPLVANVNGRPAPGFAAELLRVALGGRMQVRGDADGVDGVIIGDWFVPSLKDGTVYVPFSPPYADRYVSAHDVLTDPAAAASLQGAIVLVGLTGQGLVDFPTSPLRDRMPGVEVHAQLIEAIDEANSISRPDWARAVEAALIVLVGGLFIFAVPRLRPGIGAPVVASTLIAVLAGGAVLYATTRVLLDPVGAAVTGVVVGIAMLVSTLTLANAHRRVLGASLQREREEQARVQGQLQAAGDIQANLLPRVEGVHLNDRRYSLAAMLEPASNVGGDLYDFFRIDEDRLFVAVGDVSGKGLPASLFMAISKSLYKSAVLRDKGTIEAITCAANAEISRENPDMLFVTLFGGILDLNTGVLRFCNAGHDPPMLLRPGSPEVSQLEGGGGPPICVVDDFPYMAAEVALEPGQVVLLTTDGIGEAMNEAGELYGMERLLSLLRDLPTDADADMVLRRIYDSVKGHAGGAAPSDDITILILRWDGPPAG
jgi:serine phosphatase RsbU (regulator of sigma subunit)/CHASE2 domain-containing sensor protein